MTKTTDIEEVLATRSHELMLKFLWDDPSIVAKIQTRLQGISEENIEHYHTHFCGESKTEHI